MLMGRNQPALAVFHDRAAAGRANRLVREATRLPGTQGELDAEGVF